MTREEKLEAIYDEIDRTIVFFNQFWGIEFNWDWENYEFLPIMIGDVLEHFQDKRFYCTKCKKIVDWRDVSDDQLWGEYYCDICNNNSLLDIKDDIVFYWFKKREPIEAQEDQCVDYIYSLIKK